VIEIDRRKAKALALIRLGRCGRCGARREDSPSPVSCKGCLIELRERARVRRGSLPWSPGRAGRPPLGADWSE